MLEHRHRRAERVTHEKRKLAELEVKFVRFCESYERSEADARADFRLLCALPDVTHIAFTPGGELLIGTDEIRIFSYRTRKAHRIGSFLITIIRKREPDRTLVVDWFIQNLDGTIISSGSIVLLHPHGSASYIPELNVYRGKLCLGEQAQVQIEMLKSGRVFAFIEFLIAALKTFNLSGIPQGDVSEWPEVEV